MKIGKITARQTLSIRHQVLWPDKSESFCRVDDDDKGIHYGAEINGELIGVASVFVEGETARLRKFATLHALQGKGVGTSVIEQVLADLSAAGVRYFWCDARESALPFYQRFGMQTEGERFYKGDVSYFKMGIWLS